MHTPVFLLRAGQYNIVPISYIKYHVFGLRFIFKPASEILEDLRGSEVMVRVPVRIRARVTARVTAVTVN